MSLGRRRLLTSAAAFALSASWAPRSAAQSNVAYEYDALGRLVRVVYPNGTVVDYTYDDAGNRTQVEQGPGSPSPTGTLNAAPASISPTASSTLSWTSANATAASINNGVGSVTPVAGGSVQVSPSVTTTYVLTLTGPGGQTQRDATVTVGPPTGTFSANPAAIYVGQSTTLSWTSAGASSAAIDNGVGAVTPASGGSVQVSPTATTTYTLTLTGPSGQTTLQATVTVTNPPFNQTIQITGTGPVNLRTLANTAGYNGAQDANITFQLASGVTITGAAGSGHGIDTGTWPSSSYSITLALQVSGKVYGGGGAGGSAGENGSSPLSGGPGGDAIFAQEAMSVLVNSGGELRGGGGGGGGGGGWIFETFEPFYYYGGGGGGGFPNGPGNGDGANGTTSGGGAGAPGGAAGIGRSTGSGGAGGGVAAAGTAGAAATGNTNSNWSKMGPGAGGAAGYAVRKNGKTVSVTNNGTITGSVG